MAHLAQRRQRYLLTQIFADCSTSILLTSSASVRLLPSKLRLVNIFLSYSKISSWKSKMSYCSIVNRILFREIYKSLCFALSPNSFGIGIVQESTSKDKSYKNKAFVPLFTCLTISSVEMLSLNYQSNANQSLSALPWVEHH